MLHETDQTGSGTGYLAAQESLRSTAKWLLAAFAGAGAALAAGLQLTGLGELAADSWRLWTSAAAITLALGALGYMATSASAVLSQDWVTLASFSTESWNAKVTYKPTHEQRRRFKKIERKIDANRYELYGYAAPDIPTLHRKLHLADDMVNSPTAAEEERKAALQQIMELRAAAREVVECANYYETVELFRQMRRRLAWASAAAVIGLGVFAYAANPPQPDAPLDVRVHLASPPPTG
ncbi:hypothetical protein N4G70_35775 [Streptomyces sp. ASQP_92]|uniref:hypothetical protein n=1 Tax=Streptomyces sp. ASQP_92 TaxID=2979116 RepID=UPI0021C1B839|nr:hypothetical protein [Streptomyces sp. ASQP_92]MCT9094165.1 hypothetical protein [Streptomyces sp. ASQP_92]